MSHATAGEQPDPPNLEPGVPACTCPAWPCPRHGPEVANPMDTERRSA